MLDQAGLFVGRWGTAASDLEAAFGEFVARGYSGATIKGIARAAGLRSPALIYWYFPDKESLFGEVLETHAPVLGAIPELEGMTDALPEEVLSALGRAYPLSNRENTLRR